MEPHIIAKAIKDLFDAMGSNWGYTEWAEFLGRGTTPKEVERWTTCTIDIGPEDWQMTRVLRHCERVQRSKNCPDMPSAIANFYDVLHEIEEDSSKARDFVDLEQGEVMYQRITRFTNDDWDRKLLSYPLYIHPSRRREFIEGVIGLVDRLRHRD